MTLLEAILLTVITASTPLVIAAVGELVVERAGVVNLGVEGMMIMGAACGFAAAIVSGSTLVGVLAALAAGVAMSLIFAVLTLGLAANQVASGLALTIFGLGLSGVVGASFIGAKREAMPKLDLPVLSDIPFIGPIVFAQDPFVYLSIALVVGVWWFLTRTRAGLVLRACGENHVVRPCAGLPGAEDPPRRDHVRRRMRRSRGRLSLARLHAVLVAGHDGRARLDRARHRRLRLVAALAHARRRLFVRRREHPSTACAGHGHPHSLSTSFGHALHRHHHRARRDFDAARRRSRRAGLTWNSVCSGSLMAARSAYVLREMPGNEAGLV